MKTIIAVATVPFLSLISFQRRLSSARLGSARLSVGDPATAGATLCLQGVDAGVQADICGRQTFEKASLRNRRLAQAGAERGECSDVPGLVVDIRRRLLLYHYTAAAHESTGFRDDISHIGGLS